MSIIDLSDACALLARARKHYEELNGLVGGGAGSDIWSIRQDRDRENGEWLYRLELDRSKLTSAKPVIADIANNVVSALDHVVAAMAKAQGQVRLRSLYFPCDKIEEDFERAISRKVEPRIGTDMTKRLVAARDKHRHEVSHVAAAKQISNSGKHWELMLVASSVHGVAVHEIGQSQRIFQVPEGAFAASDDFEFYRGAEPLPNVPLSIAVGLSIEGLDADLPNSPTSIFECSFRFVDDVISMAA